MATPAAPREVTSPTAAASPPRDAGVLAVRLAGLASLAVVAVPALTVALDDAHRLRSLPVGGTFAGLTAAAALFWWLTSRRPRSRPAELLALATMSAIAVALAALDRHGLLGIQLVLVATLLPELVPPRVAIGWVLAQSILFALASLVHADAWTTAVSTVAFLGFQGFGLYTSNLAHREREGRSELARVNAELAATQRLLADGARAAERLRIARELHDVVGHHLTALNLRLEAARHTPPAERDVQVEAAREIAAGLMGEVRQVVSQLRHEPAVDLAAALDDLVRGHAAIGAGPRVSLDLASAAANGATPRTPEDPTSRPLVGIDDPAGAHALLRAAQELVTNAARHAGARHVALRLERRDGGVALEVRDDGRGAAAPRPGSGLAGMRERLESCGGWLSIDTAPGRGWVATAWIPDRAGDERP